MNNNNNNNTLTRFIGRGYLLDKDNTPKLGVFSLRKNEKGLSFFDIEKLIIKNKNNKIFEIGDKYVCVEEPNSIARCDIKENLIKEIEQELKKENNKIKLLIKKEAWSVYEKKRLHREVIFENAEKQEMMTIGQKFIQKSTLVKNQNNPFWNKKN